LRGKVTRERTQQAELEALLPAWRAMEDVDAALEAGRSLGAPGALVEVRAWLAKTKVGS